jgi:uncharacterized protein YebE (UPF0316 family)
MELFLLCIKIFAVRIIDVSLGTVRTVFTVRGKKVIASSIGFIEVLIWFLIVREALSFETSSIVVAISYSLGFATGTYIGGMLAQKLITGNITVQVFPTTNNKSIVNEIRSRGYGVTVLNYKGMDEKEDKFMLYININKRKEKELRKLIDELDDNAFVVVNETTYVENGYFK